MHKQSRNIHDGAFAIFCTYLLDMVSILEGLFNGFFNKNPVEFSLSQIENSVVSILSEKYFNQLWNGQLNKKRNPPALPRRK
jgi:hypothetical protein